MLYKSTLVQMTSTFIQRTHHGLLRLYWESRKGRRELCGQFLDATHPSAAGESLSFLSLGAR